VARRSTTYTLMMECEFCGEKYNPVATRWRCPHCGWKSNCCEGAAQQGALMDRPYNRPKYDLCVCSCRLEYHVGYCVVCGEQVCPVFRRASTENYPLIKETG
jgi:hypothetical protein